MRYHEFIHITFASVLIRLIFMSSFGEISKKLNAFLAYNLTRFNELIYIALLSVLMRWISISSFRGILKKLNVFVENNVM